MKEKIENAFLLAAVAWCGAEVMALEIMGTRVIAPLYGAGLFIWTALIAVTLLSLAAGYSLGGRWADRGRGTATVFLVLAICAGWLALLPFVSRPVMENAMGLGMRGGAFLSAALLFAAPLALLGAVGPLAIKTLSSRLEIVGRRVGFVYALSTVGSFIGAVAVGFFLIPALGLRAIVFSMAAVNGGLAGAYFLFHKRPAGFLPLLFAAALIAALFIPRPEPGQPGETVLYRGQSLFGQITVLDRPEDRLLMLDGILQSGVSKPEYLSCFEYAPAMVSLALAYRRGLRDVLMIGMGGGVIATPLRRLGIRTDAVDIDPRMDLLAKKYFATPEGPGRFFAEDGRTHLERSEEKYDAVFIDVYSGESTPAHLCSVEAFRAAKARLKPEGLLILNFLGKREGEPEAAMTRAVGRTLLEVFGQAWLHDDGAGDGFNNLLFVAFDRSRDMDLSAPVPMAENCRAAVGRMLRQRSAVARQGLLLSDDYNPVDHLDWKAREKWRAQTVAWLGSAAVLGAW
ncbi:MAG: fused MFS/spermidine synthase [Spirochaetes bacterium]|nr:fused MFS/spermidine synthase [Spirochaetota bacterium]